MNFNGLQVACPAHRSRQHVPAGQQRMNIEIGDVVEHGNRNEMAAIRRAVRVDGDDGVAALRRRLDVLVDGGLRGMRAFDQAEKSSLSPSPGLKFFTSFAAVGRTVSTKRSAPTPPVRTSPLLPVA